MSIFGGGTTGASAFGSGNNAGGTGGSIFGGNALGAKPAAPGNSIFGGGSGGSTPGATGGTTGSIFGGGATTQSTGGTTGSAFGGGTFGSLGGGNTNQPAASNPLGGGTNPPTNPLLPAGGLSAFSLSKPATPATSGSPAPGASSFFSQPPASGSGPSTPVTGGGLFGLPAKPVDSAAAAPAAGASAPTPSLFGGGAFGQKPAETGGASASATPATSAFSLGGNKDAPAPPSLGLFGASKPAEKKDAPAAGSSSLGGLFGASKPEEKKDAPAAAPSLGGLFGASKTDTPAAGSALSAFGALKSDAAGGIAKAPSIGGDKPAGFTALGGGASSTAAPAVAVAPPSVLRGKTIEDIVNKWSSDLETHVREFNKFAGEVAVWDRALIENGNNLAALYSHVLAAEREQNDVDQSLDHIEQQQKDLGATLDAYEKVTQEIFNGQGRTLDTGPADTERDKNYMLATDMHTQLDDLSSSLTQMIDAVNGLSGPSASETSTSSEDPMAQIAQILGTHLESLQWIEGAVRDVEGKVGEVEKRVKESSYATSLNGNGQSKRSFGR